MAKCGLGKNHNVVVGKGGNKIQMACHNVDI